MRVVLVLREGAHKPSTRIRMLDLVPGVAARGGMVETLVWSPRTRREVVASSASLLRAARHADVVVLQRPNLPAPVVDALRRVNPHVVVDFDDALWVGSDDRYAPTYGARLEHAVRSARVITPGSEYLAAWVRRIVPSAPVVVVRSAVDTDAIVPTPRPAAGVPVAIWIGSPGNFADFGDEVSRALRDAVAANRVRLRVVSSQSFDRVPSELVRWSPEAEVEALATADIGLMPLRDTRRSRGRCGFKAIQYMAAGLPVVASDVGAAPELVAPGRSGVLVTPGSSWAGALDAVVDEPHHRAAWGRAGRDWVDEHASRAVSTDRLWGALVRAAS